MSYSSAGDRQSHTAIGKTLRQAQGDRPVLALARNWLTVIGKIPPFGDDATGALRPLNDILSLPHAAIGLAGGCYLSLQGCGAEGRALRRTSLASARKKTAPRPLVAGRLRFR